MACSCYGTVSAGYGIAYVSCCEATVSEAGAGSDGNAVSDEYAGSSAYAVKVYESADSCMGSESKARGDSSVGSSVSEDDDCVVNDVLSVVYASSEVVDVYCEVSGDSGSGDDGVVVSVSSDAVAACEDS